jgi:hypothetical protein
VTKSPNGVRTSIAEGFLIEERGQKSPRRGNLESSFNTLLDHAPTFGDHRDP